MNKFMTWLHDKLDGLYFKYAKLPTTYIKGKGINWNFVVLFVLIIAIMALALPGGLLYG